MFDDVHNYFEKIVYEKIMLALGEQRFSSDLVEDIACITLNQLPPRYIRFDVDMMFGLSAEERHKLEDKVNAALEAAINKVNKNQLRGN